jgi:flavin reductase (DIM6/NTAB) family NADH-FMN oxidoreductase RutF
MTAPTLDPIAHLVEVDGVSMETSDARSRALRGAFGRFPSGVTAVCADLGSPTDGGAGTIGMAVSSFTSVSVDPALVSVCIDNGSNTWPRLRGAGRLGVSVLGAEHAGAARQLAAKSGDRFADLSLEDVGGGAVLIHGASAWFDCTVYDELPAGDHVIVLLQVHRFSASPGNEPLVFHGSGFRSLA